MSCLELTYGWREGAWLIATSYLSRVKGLKVHWATYWREMKNFSNENDYSSIVMRWL